MSLSNFESQLTPSIIKWCNLEELIYYLIDENVDSAKNLISQFDDSERDSLFQLVQSAAEAIRMHFHNSGEIWKSIGKPNHAFENTYFIEYLYHQKILDKEYLEWPCRTNPIDDPESLFYGSDTIEHALMKHDFDRVVYLSADINPTTKYYYNFMQISNRSLICNVPKLQYQIDSEDFLNLYPINAGLMFGKTTEILKLCRLLANVSLCIGMFQGGCEQSLINYVYHNGMINKTGVIIRAHHMNEGQIISCPEWLSESQLRQSDNWYLVHHFYEISRKYALSQRIRDIININP